MKCNYPVKCPLCGGKGTVEKRSHPVPATIIGKEFKEARIRKGLTIRDVEKVTGLSNATVSQLENGIIENPSFNSVVSLSNLYEINVQWLINLAQGNFTDSKGGTS